MPITPVYDDDSATPSQSIAECRIGFFAIDPSNIHNTGEYMLETYKGTQMLRAQWSEAQQALLIWALVPQHALIENNTVNTKLWLIPGCDASPMNPYTALYLGTVDVPMDEDEPPLPWHVFHELAATLSSSAIPVVSLTMH